MYNIQIGHNNKIDNLPKGVEYANFNIQQNQ
jgi:hypothetical protein